MKIVGQNIVATSKNWMLDTGRQGEDAEWMGRDVHWGYLS